ncbi:MAG: hypothetical protein MJB14_12905 [Spirochaetes bacterium]|nr:hypothetical protein [Spirochaetota bacterium]
MFEEQVLNWLLEADQPSIRYRTLTELLDYPHDHPDVSECFQQLPESLPVQTIFSKMHPEGYWLQTNPRTKEVTGKGVKYGSFATTHFCLAYLAELGLNRSHPLLDKAVQRYLNQQSPDGDFWNHMSCLYAYNIRNFIMLGYKEEPRVQKSIQLMIKTARADGGYLCDMHDGKYKTRQVKSCIRGAGKALLAFAELPEYHNHPRCQKLIQYFLERDLIFDKKTKTKILNRDQRTTSFPITWQASLPELLLGMSKLGYGQNKELSRAWELLETKKTAAGWYILDHTPSQSPFKVGKKGEPNKWITFYVLLAKKFKNQTS